VTDHLLEAILGYFGAEHPQQSGSERFDGCSIEIRCGFHSHHIVGTLHKRPDRLTEVGLE
jgi:hypothetical protein